MGAGSSTEQRSPEQPEAGSATPAEPEPEPSGGGSAAEAAPGSSADATIAAADPATKLLQKNGQLSTVNGLAEQGELGLQEGALNGQEEEVTVPDVGQRESEDVTERDSDKDMAANSAAVQDITKEGQEEMPEMMEQIPASESSVDELMQPAEPQANDVGFKKVFKFVGFKFSVKKDKTEKSDTVQLLTVKKDEGGGPGGSDGAGDGREPSQETGDATPTDTELKQSTETPEETPRHELSRPEVSLQAESGPPAEEGKDEGEEKQEKEAARSPDSPTSPVASETASPFKKFFTQGWAGWRKKTSFRKPREDELEASEKKKEQEPEKADTEENEKTEDLSEQPPSQEARESAQDARLSAEYEKVELPPEDQGQAPPEEKPAPLATEVFDEKVEIVAEVHVSTAEKGTEEQKAKVEEAVEPSPPERSLETDADLLHAEPPEAEALLKMQEEVGAPSGDHAQPAELCADAKGPPTPPEGVAGEVEVPSSQERTKVQGSPLKKLFTSSGLKKLSGKKQKGKRGGDEESGEQHPASADSPDSPDEPKGESSASSPEEPEEITCLEKGVAEAPQDGETEEGTASDGEKKREGVTPWASFKKMVTPKKRVRRLSESDKEDEVDKVKSGTLSSTESAASEMQEEGKGNGEEQKPEEPKRKVDTSVSWEALICVGSSKKRARKASSSDDEGGPKPLGGDSQKPEEAGRDREPGPDALPAGSQDHDQPPGSSSPEQAGSPSEGEGVSTWESFKRLVTSRKKPKSKLEEKSEDLVAGSGLEYSASDAELGKEESWVSIRKFIPGRRKKRLDGKQEQAAMEDTGPTEVNEDDSDVPAVVPLSEYDAVEREKTEAQQALKNEEGPEQKVAVDVSEELSKSLVHTVTVAVMDGTRAVTSIEERAPSWISASVTEPLEQAEDEDRPPSGEVFEKEVVAEKTPVDTKTLPESQQATDDTVSSKVELTPEALTAAETTEAFCAEEATEASGAEETTDMVSAVSQLTDFPDTTEEATPVQEVEGSVPDMEDQAKRIQEVLQAVAEKVKEESQLPDARGLDDTIQTTQKGQAKILEQVEEAEEDSHALDQKEAMDGASKEHVQETKTETLTQGTVIVQATPESLEEIPPGTESAEARELTGTCPAEIVAAVKPETVPEQAVAPDSAETLTDSETNGSTPVADFEATNVSQQTKILEIDEDGEVPSGTQYQVTEGEALPELKEMPPEPPNFQSQEEKHSKMEEVLEHTDKEVTVETVPILSKTEVIQEAGRCADEEAKEEPSVEGLVVSADTEIPEKKITEVALEDEVMKKAEFQKNDDLELQRPAKSLPTPVERERVVQVERDKTELEPTQVNEEKLECKPAVTTCEELSKQLVQAVNVTIIDGEKEVISFEGSSLPVHEEEACTEIQVQSSEASLALTAAAVGEKVLGEAIKILETAETLESAEARLVPEGKSSEKDEGSPAQPGDDAVPTGTESQAKSIPVIVSVTPEKGISTDLEGDKTTSQKWESDGDGEQVGCQEGRVSKTREEDLKAENEILKLETESCKLVQNVIQTVVDQLGSTEETAAAFQTQVQLTEADSQEAGQKIEKEESKLQACTLDETQTMEAKEESPLSAGEHTHPDVSEDVNEALEKMAATRVESSRVDGQQLEEVAFPSKEKREAPEAKSVPEDDGGARFGERTEKSPFESREDEKGDAADDPGNQTSAPEDAEASGGSTKESPDTTGPKLKEKGDGQEVEFQEEKVQSESEKEIKTQTQEETQGQERAPAQPEPTES
ncbi:A-kinase anchor protein 12 [Mesoplodon densirostris]|uniref:A-kinase anchor protein 12 n=1 Tax=Mesoplodon densirostris TaxID=48708 RepID=UPI0028DD0B0C|nr:A-kinase anchor protein 12 [Mesoplodon densirostris]